MAKKYETQLKQRGYTKKFVSAAENEDGVGALVIQGLRTRLHPHHLCVQSRALLQLRMTKKITSHKGGRTARLPGVRVKPEVLTAIRAECNANGWSIGDWVENHAMKSFFWPSLNITVIASSRESAVETAVGLSTAQPAHYLTRGETPLAGDELRRALEAEEPLVSDFVTKSLTI